MRLFHTHTIRLANQEKASLIAVALFLGTATNAQIIGGTGNNDPSPKEAKVSELSPSTLQGDVDLFTGRYSASHPLGAVSTPGGLSYSLDLVYSPTFKGGTTPTVIEGTPYGAGWDVNVPTITISKADIHHYKKNHSIGAPPSEFDTTAATYNLMDERYDGHAVWFAPIINIPGVASGRAVFKRYNSIGSEFILSTFDNYLEISFDGNKWIVKANNGKVYTFGGVASMTMPSNQRALTYEELDNYTTNPGGYRAESARSKIAHSIKPDEETLSWYCTQITDPLHLPGDRIRFEWVAYGLFDFYPELQQEYYTKMLEAELHRSGELYSEFSSPWLAWPVVETAQGMYLNRVWAVSQGGFMERLDMNYEDRFNNVSNVVVPDSNTIEPDSMLIGEVVYSAGTGVSGDFDDWHRYPHMKSPLLFEDSSITCSTDPKATNPYVNAGDNKRYRVGLSTTGNNDLSFSHSILESPRIMKNIPLAPGDIYEIKAQVVTSSSASNQNRGYMDIAVLSGDGDGINSTGWISNTTYTTNHERLVHSTFDRALKWHTHGQDNTGTVNISTRFVMPDLPQNAYGDTLNGQTLDHYNGFTVQFGPANSDNDFSLGGSGSYTEINNGTNPSAYRSYLHHRWAEYFNGGCYDSTWTITDTVWSSATSFTIETDTASKRVCPNYTGLWAHGIPSHHPIQQNFGIGLPWSMLLNVHKQMTPDGYANAVGSDSLNLVASTPFQFWWNDDTPCQGTPNDYDWNSVPTLLGDGVKLKKVEVIRYSRKPRVLASATLYRMNGDYSGIGSPGEVAVSEYTLEFDHDLQPNYRNVGFKVGASNNFEPQLSAGDIPTNLFKLEAIRKSPTNPTQNDSISLSPASEQPTTRFEYSSASDFNTAYWDSLIYADYDCAFDGDPYIDPIAFTLHKGVLLDRIVDPLGAETHIVYNDLRDRKLREESFAGAVLYTGDSATSICNRRYDIVIPPLFTVTPTIKEIRRSDENGADSRVWTYNYSDKMVRPTQPALDYHYRRSPSGSGRNYGFARVEKIGPALSTGERNREVYKFHGDHFYNDTTISYGDVDVTFDLLSDFPDTNAVNFDEFLLFGKLKSVEVYGHDSTLYERRESFYEPLLAFVNGNSRKATEELGWRQEYIDMLPDAEQQPIPTPRGLSAGTGIGDWKNPGFLELYPDSLRYPLTFPESFKHSWFIRKIQDKVTTYEPNGCVKDDTPPIIQWPNDVAETLDPSSPHTNEATNENSETLIESLSSGVDEENVDTMNENSPLQESVLDAAIRNTTSANSSHLKDVLLTQSKLSEARLLQLVTETSDLKAADVVAVMLAQTTITDTVFINILDSDDFSSAQKKDMITDPEKVSTKVVEHMLSATPAMTSKNMEEVITHQPDQPFATLEDILNTSAITDNSKGTILLDQAGYDTTIFRNLENSFGTFDANALENILVNGPTYPDEDFIEELILHTPAFSSTMLKNVILAADHMPSTRLQSIIDTTAHLNHIDRVALSRGFDWTNLPQYCGNPNLTSTLKIENITDYEYFDAHYTGQTWSNGFKRLMGLETTDTIQLLWEPSWQLYSTKKYSPQQPGAYITDEYFYYQDLINRYDRHWDHYPNTFGVYTVGDTIFGVDMLEAQFGGQAYELPDLPALVRIREFQDRTPELFQHRVRKNNGVDSTEHVSSTYHFLSNGWEVQVVDTLVPTDTIYGPACPPGWLYPNMGGTTTGTTGGTGQPAVADAYLLRDLNKDTWQDHTDRVPDNYLLVELNDNYFIVPAADLDTTNNDINVLYNPAFKNLVVSILIGGSLQTRSIHVQADGVKKDLSGRKFIEQDPLMDFLEIDPDPGDTTNPVEWHPDLPYLSILRDSILNRNELLQVESRVNERGLITRYEYTANEEFWRIDPVHPCNNDGGWTWIDRGLPQKVIVGSGLVDSLTTEFIYHLDGRIDSIIDPNGTILSYTYDDFGRLLESYQNGTLLARNNYKHYNNSALGTYNFDGRSSANYVESFTLVDSGSTEALQSRAYMDPNGRSYGSIEREVSDHTAPASTVNKLVFRGNMEFDEWDRTLKAYKPFTYSDNGNYFSFALDSAIRAANSTGTSYGTFSHELDPRGRMLREAKPGEALVTGHNVEHGYKMLDYMAFACEAGISSGEAEMLMPTDEMDYVWTMKVTTDEDGKKSRVFSNANGQQVATQQFIDSVSPVLTLFLHDNMGNVREVINPKKQSSKYAYNILGQLYQKETVDAGVTKYMYDLSGNVVLTQDENLRAGHVHDGTSEVVPEYRRTVFDVHNRPIRQERIRTVPKFDGQNAGIRSKHVDVLTYANVSKGYANGVVTLADSLCYQLFTSASTIYEFAGFLLSTNDGGVPAVVGSTFVFVDTLLIDPIIEKEWTYDYNTLVTEIGPSRRKGRLASTKTWPNRTYPWYQTGNNALNVQNGFVHHVTYSYDDRGNLAWQGQELFEQNVPALNKKVRLDYMDYDLRGNARTINVDVGGNSILDAQHHYTYDARGHLREVYLNLDNSTDGGELLASYDYDDALGLLTTTKYFRTCSSGGSDIRVDSIVNTYDVRDRLTAISGTHYGEELYYDEDTLVYDSLNALVASHLNFNGNINSSKHSYNFSAMTNSSLASGVLSLPGYQGYKYDGLNRLTSVDGVSGNIADGKTSMSDPEFRVGDASYSYDQIGNITDLGRWGYFTFSPTAPELQGWSYNYGSGNNRLQSVDSSAANVSASRNYTYDLNGNLLSDSYRNIDTTVYGRANLPFLVNKTVGSSDESIDYLYNASDMRIFKKHIDHDTANVDTLAMQFYLRDASGRELGVYDVLTDQWTHYAFGGSRFAKFTPVSSQQPSNLGSGSTPTHPISYTFMSTATKDTVSFYNFDHLGNTRVVYETDQPTAHNSCTSPLRLSSAVDYFPYGKVLREVRAGDAEKYLTTHHERDTETGLDYRGARMYDGDVARFLSLDPAAAEYPAWSDYNYVLANPVSFVDPDGRNPWHYELDEQGQTVLVADEGDNVKTYAQQFGLTEDQSFASLYNLGLIEKLSEGSANPTFGVRQGARAIVSTHEKLDLSNASDEGIVDQLVFALQKSRSDNSDRVVYNEFFSSVPSTFRDIRASGTIKQGADRINVSVELPMRAGGAYSESFNTPSQSNRPFIAQDGEQYQSIEYQSSKNREPGNTTGSLRTILIRAKLREIDKVRRILQ